MRPDRRRALEEERDFLLTSLDDLEAEHAAGDVSEDDYRTLRDDYTARAATVLRSLEGGRTRTPRTRSSTRRWLAPVVGVVAVALVAGVAVAQASGRRGDGGLTGLDVESARNRIDDCQALELDGDADGALACYSEVLDSLPANVDALTFRGWLQIREGDVDGGLADLDAAIQLAPEATAPYIFRASGRSRSDDAPGAVADLATFYANDPSDDEAALAVRFAAGIVERALDVCIDGDVTGRLDPVSVLDCYRNVLAVDDDNATASAYLGWLLARSGADDDAALALLDDALAQDPGLTAAHVFRAALRAHLGDTDGARSDLDRFATLDAPADQVAAAAQVRAALDEGRDPLG